MALAQFRGGGKVEYDRVRPGGRFRFAIDLAQVEEKIVRPIAEQVAEVGKERAQQLAPVRTGVLRSSIESQVRKRNGRLEARVLVNVNGTAPYWAFVEYGTGLRGAASPQVPPLGTPAGWRYDYRDQGWVGQQAQPFLRPALLTMWRSWVQRARLVA